MSTEANITPIFDLVNKLLIFLERPGVQIQLVAITVALSIAILISVGLWAYMNRLFPAGSEAEKDGPYSWRDTLPIVIGYLIFPVLGLLALNFARAFVQAQGWFDGLLAVAISIFWTFLLYRIFIGVLYMLFPVEKVRRYHLRLFAPIFVVFIVLLILSQLTDLNQLGNVVLTTLFDSPITLAALFFATVGLYLWIDAAWGVQDVSFHLITRRTSADPGAVEAGLTLLRYMLITAGVIIVISNLGLNSTTVAAIMGGLSVGIGFALREVLSNFISGIFLLFEGSLHPGDVVDINGEVSVVKRLSIRSTRVQTRNNVEVVIPNLAFFTSAFTTYTGSDRNVRVLIPIGASYNDDPETVIKILEEVGQSHPEVRTEPKPTALLTGFGDSSVDFNLAVWVSDPIRIVPITSDLYRAIWQAFAKNRLEIPFPQQDVHLRSGVPWHKFGNGSLPGQPEAA